MLFYPQLYEELTQKELERAIGKLVGAIRNNIDIDEYTDKILQVNGKRRNDQIKGWQDIKDMKQHAPKLAKYVQSVVGDKYDIRKVLDDFDQNQKKAKEQAAGKAKTWKPIDLPPFPTGLTWGNFWDYQFETHPEEFAEFSQETTDKKSTRKSYSKKDERIVTELDIPESLTKFFKENGKIKEWAAFAKNVTYGEGRSIIGVLDDIVTIMDQVLLNEVDEDPTYTAAKKIKLQLTTPEEREKWKKDMLDYIGKYTTDNILDINKDETYIKEVLNSGTFLNMLFIAEPKGVGRGEILMAYIMKGARFAGGSESFDVTANNITYELKDYSDAGGSIRLGAHGALTRFDWWKQMERTIEQARIILTKLGPEKLKKILDNPAAFAVWNFVASEEPYQGTRVVGSAVEAGEVNSSKIATLKVFYALAHELLTRGKRDETGKYTYAILKGNDVKPETVNINPVDKSKVNKIDKLDVSVDKDDLTAFKELSSIKYVRDPLQFQKDLDKIGEEYSKNAHVDYFMVFLPKEVSIKKLENYVFDTISQKGVKIIDKERRSKDKGEQHADRAFKTWKGQDDKSYYEVYQDTRTGVNESYYPRLFKD
jgi:hypothetical protein